MKFLVLTTPRPSPTIPPKAAAAALSATREWLGQRRTDGTFECAYGLVTGGGCAIVEVESHEALNKLMLDAPASMISDYEVWALGDADVQLGNAISALERAASMMPQSAS
jgi:hypothetical protein